MIDNETNLSTLSDNGLSSVINKLSSELSNYQILLWDCFKKREKRHIQNITNLQAIINRVRDISNKGNIHGKRSIDESLINCLNTPTVVLTISDNKASLKNYVNHHITNPKILLNLATIFHYHLIHQEILTKARTTMVHLFILVIWWKFLLEVKMVNLLNLNKKL